jgi:transposase InsO family protein
MGLKQSIISQGPYPRYPNLIQELTVTSSDQVWLADITYVRLSRECVYLAVLMDGFTRCIRGWHLAGFFDQALTLTALKKALAQAVPEIHHSIQGVEYSDTTYLDLLRHNKVQISMADGGEARQNAHPETLFRTLKAEELSLSKYQDYFDIYRQIDRFLDDVYVHKRLELDLGCLAQAKHQQPWSLQQTLAHSFNLETA